MANCPLCEKTAEVKYDPGRSVSEYECACCGKFKITEEAEGVVKEFRDHNQQYEIVCISAFTRQRTERRKRFEYRRHYVPFIFTSAKVAQQPIDGLIGIDDILAGAPKTVADRLDKALLSLADMGHLPGEILKLTKNDLPIGYAETVQVLVFLLQQLREKNYLAQDFVRDLNDPTFIAGAQITAFGWNRVAELQRGNLGAITNQAFVAMWFGAEVQEAYELGLEPAIREADYDPMRIDAKEHSGKIDDAIIAEIRKSRFLVADFTGQRGGVYYEAGFALGLGMPVIWTCREDAIGDLHFDTRQYNHIAWKEPDELRIKLKRRIKAVIGRSPST